MKPCVLKELLFLCAGTGSVLGISRYTSLDIGISIGKWKMLSEHLYYPVCKSDVTPFKNTASRSKPRLFNMPQRCVLCWLNRSECFLKKEEIKLSFHRFPNNEKDKSKVARSVFSCIIGLLLIGIFVGWVGWVYLFLMLCSWIIKSIKLLCYSPNPTK